MTALRSVTRAPTELAGEVEDVDDNRPTSTPTPRSMRTPFPPEDVPPLAAIDMPDLEQHGYRAYPLVDHIADKVAATFERYGEARIPSTRYRTWSTW
jgi:hypothetical protein